MERSVAVLRHSARRAIGLCAIVLLLTIVISFAGAQEAFAESVSGFVKDYPADTPIAGIQVRVIADSESNLYTGSTDTTVTAADGSFTVTGLPGTDYYYVSFIDTSDVYRDSHYFGQGVPLGSTVPIWVDGDEDLGTHYMATRTEVMSHRVQRVAGSDRFDTAIKMAYRFGSADTAIIASGMGFPDALAAAPLAGTFNAPILLTAPNKLPSGLVTCLRDIGVDDVIIVGGTAVVDNGVQSSLQSAGFTVNRIAGSNRYNTAALIAATVVDANGGASHSACEPILVRGDAFADALAVAPFAWLERRPILLTQPDFAPNETLSAFAYLKNTCGVDTTYVMGGEGAVSDYVLGDIWYYVYSPGDLYYARFAGSDRYTTARAVIKDYWGWDLDMYAVASGETFPDALSAGPYMGKVWGGLLLTPKASLASAAKNQLVEDREYIWDVFVAGGTGAVSSTAYNSIAPAIGSYHYDMDSYSGVVGMPSGGVIESSLADTDGTVVSGRSPLEHRLARIERAPETYAQRNQELQSVGLEDVNVLR